ncbi:M6 family metalloprotease domain-containing protein [Halorussus rarus]|uniref:M6 family metalloprotease domain-containing protein n=1 Tax=Halorussus TaxID=1070314 RepID=UPI0013B416D0|nr:M6 family metalloprotease domain-containing protein [Halorussus rarus]NHN58954.1 M6 family metalloprotease domain-containing protein [Halorussus sp. JP-T4]
MFVLVAGQAAGFAGAAGAVPAPDDYVTKTQPDGAEFQARQWGNEFNHGWETKAGYTVTRGADGWWRYAALDAGELVPTDRKVVVDDPPGRVPKHLRGTADASPKLTPSAVESDSSTASLSATRSPSGMPTTGTVNLPVVLINYDDTATTYSVTDFQRLLFGDDPAIASGPGSMKDYYQEVSYGQLNISGGSAGVTGWYTAENGHDYYGESYVNAAKLAKEAVRKSDATMDFSEYDNDGDGTVDGVIVIHQGPGQEASGDATDIWSHRWSFRGAGIGAYQTDDGVTVNSYSLQPETYRSGITTVGVVAHETGHLFGMPDLYDTDGGSEGIGNWGLMGGGSWNGVNRPGDSPAHLTAFLKSRQGWLTPAEQSLTGPMGTLGPYANNSEAFRWLDNPYGVQIGGTGEYFLATNRRQTGFDRGLPGEGLLITHIDESRTDNQDAGRKLVDVEAADGDRDMDAERNRGDAGDPFPGSTNADAFAPSTTPGSTLYDGSASGLEITDVTTDGTDVGVNIVPSASASPSSVDYGEVHVAETATDAVTVTNDGYRDLNVTGVRIAGADAASFEISSGIGETVLAPGESSALDVAFAPGERAGRSATLVVEHNASGSPTEVPLTGTGVAPDYNVTPANAIDYGDVAVGGEPARESVVVENNGSAPLNVTGATFAAPNASSFGFAAGSEVPATVVPPGGSVTFGVNLSVDSLGDRAAHLELSHNVSDRPAINLTLTGTGADLTPPAVADVTAVNESSQTTELTAGDAATVSAAVTDAVGVETVTVNASALGDATVALTDGDGDGVYDATVPVDAPDATEGSHALPVTATDAAGHSTTVDSNAVAVDFTAPALRVEAPAEGAAVNGSDLTATATASDAVTAVAEVEVKLDGGAWTAATLRNGTWEHTFGSVSEGEHAVAVRATDNVSNVGDAVTRNVTVDRTEPSIGSAALDRTENVLPETLVRAAVESSDDRAGVASVTVDGVRLRNESGFWTGNVSAASELGPETVTVAVTDRAGNRNATTLDYDVGRNATLNRTGASTYRATPASTPVIRNVTMNVSAGPSDRNVTVGTATANPATATPGGDAALFFPQVDTTVPNADIENATVAVRLDKDRYADLFVEADSTTFWAHDGSGWHRTTGTLRRETGDAYWYDFETTHFSAFAVTGDVEDEPPSVTAVTPGDGDSTTDRNLTVGAEYGDDFSGVDPSTVQLSVDGRAVTSSATVTDSAVSYASSFAVGTHSVTLTVGDEANNVRTRSWTFTVAEPAVGGGDGGGSDGGGGGGGGGDVPPPMVQVEVLETTDSYARAEITSARRGSPGTVRFDSGLTGGDATFGELSVRPESADATARFLVEATASGSAPEGVSALDATSSVLGYLTLTPTYVTDSELRSVTTAFRVDASRAAAPENVAVYRYDGTGWNRVHTEFVAERGGAYEFEASAGATGTYAVGLATPSFAVQDLTVDRAGAGPDEPVTVSATVENVGDGAGTKTLALAVDGRTVATREVTLGPGNRTAVAFERTFEPGEHRLAVGAAETTLTVERNETDRAGLEQARKRETTSGSAGGVPGFGAPAALAALVAAVALAGRRRG